MKLAKVSLLSLGLLPLVAAVAPAYADTLTFDWTLTSPATAEQGGFALLGGGTLTATTGANGDAVTDITGTLTSAAGSETVTGLASFFNSDNLVFPGPAGTVVLSGNGLAFSTSAGESVNIFSFEQPGAPVSGNAYGEESSVNAFQGVGLFNLTPVPLPASWTLLLTGLAGFGALGLRRKGALGSTF